MGYTSFAVRVTSACSRGSSMTVSSRFLMRRALIAWFSCASSRSDRSSSGERLTGQQMMSSKARSNTFLNRLRSYDGAAHVTRFLRPAPVARVQAGRLAALWHGIVTRSAPRMAPPETLEREPRAAQRPEALDRLGSISRTGRQIAALPAEPGRERELVDLDHGEQRATSRGLGVACRHRSTLALVARRRSLHAGGRSRRDAGGCSGDAAPAHTFGLVLDHDASFGEPIADPIRFPVVAVTAESVALREQRVNLRGVDIAVRGRARAREPHLRIRLEQPEQRA